MGYDINLGISMNLCDFIFSLPDEQCVPHFKMFVGTLSVIMWINDWWLYKLSHFEI